MLNDCVVVLHLFATALCASRHHHQSLSSSSEYSPAPIVSTYTVATLIPVSRSAYDPFGGDSLSLNQGGLAPVTVTVTTLVPLLSTITETVTAGSPNSTLASNVQAASSTGTGDTSDGSGTDGESDGSSADSSSTDGSADPATGDPDSPSSTSFPIITSWSTSTYRPQFASTTKKHHFW